MAMHEARMFASKFASEANKFAYDAQKFVHDAQKAATTKVALIGPKQGRRDIFDSHEDDTLYDRAVDAFIFMMRAFCTFAIPRLDWIMCFMAVQVIDPLLALFTGSYYPPTAPSKEKQVLSLINSTDPEFRLPELDGKPLYNPSNFPFPDSLADPHGFHEWNAHFLILASKVAYEDEKIVAEVITREWEGWKFIDSFYTEPKNAKKVSTRERAKRIHDAAFKRRTLTDVAAPEQTREQKLANKVTANLIPSTAAFMMSNDNAVVVFFRGTQPYKLAQWWSDCDLDLVVRTNARGKVHQGFWEALFYQAPAKTGQKPYPSVFHRICTALAKDIGTRDKKIYVTGHSLGAGLASMFAHTLAHPETANPQSLPPTVGYAGAGELASKIGGVYTWASPTAGNYTWAQFLIDNYGNKLFRVVHSADIIPKIPFGQGYRHHKREYFINYTGDIYHDPEAIEAWRVCESDQFDFFYLCKILAGWTTWAPWGAPNGSAWLPNFVVFFNRCMIHTLIRVAMFALGPLVPGHVVSGIPDHFPCDYEIKMRRAALDLGRLLSVPLEKRHRLRTHMISRTEEHTCHHDDDFPATGAPGAGHVHVHVEE
ncbi:hypothetical protein WJX72_002511 [[Myrmecia] bisecta]|uniref:Fungal lipase-type domain-containing protein n=1 Tax=[Myrmecia] bisecta TaxID=41462 RepID=A0AAW1P4K0_9CHLO